jgi:hypothetical protein
MKKLLLLALPVIMLTSCDKILLKNVSVQIDASSAVTTVALPDGEYKYFGGMTKEELKEQYITELRQKLNSGKIHVVESGADYVLRVERIEIIEEIDHEYYDDTDWGLSRVSIRTTATINQNQVDIPNNMIFETESREELDTDSKKGKKGKNGKYIEIDGFGGREGAMRENATVARKEVKEYVKTRQ